MKIGFNIKGAKEFDLMLRDLGPQVAKNAGAAALRAGGKVILARAKELVPVKTGALRDSLGIRVLRGDTGVGSLRAHIGSTNEEYRLMHLVEFGTKAHAIRVKNSGVLASGDTVFGKEVNVSGSPARPFLRPALDEKAGDALGAMGAALSKAIIREAKKFKRVLPNGRNA